MSSLSIGIVGFPNVGKSTLFNALLKKQVALAANYPFATIEPNVGVVPVPDERLPILAKVVNTSVIKPATVEFVDIAGLVRGAATGAGLGNQFLSHIRETSAIAHVLRAFSDPDVIREGATEPGADLEAIRLELALADLATLQKQVAPKGAADPATKKRWQIVEQLLKIVEAGQTVISWSADQAQFDSQEVYDVCKELNLLTSKSELFVLNVDEADLPHSEKIALEYSAKLNLNPQSVIVMCAKIESEICELSEEDQQMYLADLGIKQSGLNRLISAAYATLGLQSFLTAGEKEVRAWTINKGSLAPAAAGVIHTDFAKKFISAKVATYQDFVECGGWKGLKEQGKVRQEGRGYVMQENDVVEFLIGT